MPPPPLNLPQKVNRKRPAQVELDPFQNLQLHLDNVRNSVRLVSYVHKVLNLKQHNSKGVQQNIRFFFKEYPLTFTTANEKRSATP